MSGGSSNRTTVLRRVAERPWVLGSDDELPHVFAWKSNSPRLQDAALPAQYDRKALCFRSFPKSCPYSISKFYGQLLSVEVELWFICLVLVVQAWPEMKLQFARIFEQKTRNEWATGSVRFKTVCFQELASWLSRDTWSDTCMVSFHMNTISDYICHALLISCEARDHVSLCLCYNIHVASLSVNNDNNNNNNSSALRGLGRSF